MNDPLQDQLADLAHAAGAASDGLGQSTVRRVATRVRRRRAARQVGTGAVAACAVGAVAWGAGQVQGASSRLPAGPTAPVSPAATVTRPPSASATPSVEHPPRMMLWEKYFACGEPVGMTIHSRPDAGGLVLAADEDLSVTLGVAGDASVTATVPTAGTFALVGDDGTVVGYLYPDEDDLVETDLRAAQGDTTRLDGGVHLVACESADIPAEAVAWPFVQATVRSTTADDEGRRAVVVAADPRTLDLTPFAADRGTAGLWAPVTILEARTGASAGVLEHPVVELDARTVALQVAGSSSCPPIPKRARFGSDVIQVVVGRADDLGLCTADRMPTTYVLAMPQGFAPTDAPTVEVIHEEQIG